ncbi:MAG: hypothetical protein M3464_19130 [Chloroflexota bacterium]|nr:hypothetical protein [Chloroflexota bacterium]
MTTTWRAFSQVTALALAGGLGGGLLLWLATVLVERSGFSGDGWSLRGNGALIVPFLGLPAVLIVGTIALARRVGGSGRWWLVAVASVVLGLGLVVGLFAAARLTARP